MTVRVRRGSDCVVSGRTESHPGRCFRRDCASGVTLCLWGWSEASFRLPVRTAFRVWQREIVMRVPELEAVYGDDAFAVVTGSHAFCVTGTLASIIRLWASLPSDRASCVHEVTSGYTSWPGPSYYVLVNIRVHNEGARV